MRPERLQDFFNYFRGKLLLRPSERENSAPEAS